MGVSGIKYLVVILFALLLDDPEPFRINVLDRIYKPFVAVIVDLFLLLRRIRHAYIGRLVLGVLL